MGGPTCSTAGAAEPSPKVEVSPGEGTETTELPETTEPTQPLPTKPVDAVEAKNQEPEPNQTDVSLETPVEKAPKSPIELDQADVSLETPAQKASKSAIDLESDSESGDDYVPESPPEPPQISKAAAGARLRRLFTPRSDGSYQVPQEAVQMYKDLDQRRNLEKMFERCAFSPVTCKNG